MFTPHTNMSMGRFLDVLHCNIKRYIHNAAALTKIRWNRSEIRSPKNGQPRLFYDYESLTCVDLSKIFVFKFLVPPHELFVISGGQAFRSKMSQQH